LNESLSRSPQESNNKAEPIHSKEEAEERDESRNFHIEGNGGGCSEFAESFSKSVQKESCKCLAYSEGDEDES
jgi:hypothetical protein